MCCGAYSLLNEVFMRLIDTSVAMSLMLQYSKGCGLCWKSVQNQFSKNSASELIKMSQPPPGWVPALDAEFVAVHSRVWWQQKNCLITLIGKFVLQKPVFVYSHLSGFPISPLSRKTTTFFFFFSLFAGSGLKVPVLWASVQYSRRCSDSPQLLTTHAKTCIHISEKIWVGAQLLKHVYPRNHFKF